MLLLLPSFIFIFNPTYPINYTLMQNMSNANKLLHSPNIVEGLNNRIAMVG